MSHPGDWQSHRPRSAVLPAICLSAILAMAGSTCFDQNTDQFLGQLMGRNGKPISIDGLWTLTPENGGSAGDPSTIYFTAGQEKPRGCSAA